jgi:hypothetical protein
MRPPLSAATGIICSGGKRETRSCSPNSTGEGEVIPDIFDEQQGIFVPEYRPADNIFAIYRHIFRSSMISIH